MHLVPTQEEVVKLLRRTGGLRDGHFEYSNGLHANEYLQVALTMRYYDAAKILSVGVSRQLRAHSDIRAMIPELSIVAPGLSGLPVAYGVCEALRADVWVCAGVGEGGRQTQDQNIFRVREVDRRSLENLHRMVLCFGAR